MSICYLTEMKKVCLQTTAVLFVTIKLNCFWTSGCL